MTDDDRGDHVRIERTLSAPADLVWRMWTQPEHFKAWYGPAGAAVPVADIDLRIGGTRRVCLEMATPQGTMRMWFTGEHREIVENKRLVYTESMADEEGNVKSPSELGMPAGHPTTTEVMVELEAAGESTRLVLTHVGVPAGSPGATGWEMALDKLADHVGRAGRLG